MPDYSQMISYLQNLLSNSQNMWGQQFNTGLTAQQEAYMAGLANQKAMQDAALASQAAMQGASLGEGGRQFDASLALQKVISDWQNQLANKEFGLKEQDFGLKEQAQKAALDQQAWQNDWRNQWAMKLQPVQQTNPIASLQSLGFLGGNQKPGFPTTP